MTLENIGDKAALAAAADLRSSMQGKVVLPCDRDYADVRIIWNGAVEHQPALIARCETTRDVQYAIRTAATYGLRLAVRGGGHDWAGRSVCHDGLMIDLSAMRQVNVEVATKAAVVAGGATAADVVDAAAPHGLVAVTGNCGTVGMAGLTLGGGYAVERKVWPRFGQPVGGRGRPRQRPIRERRCHAQRRTVLGPARRRRQFWNHNRDAHSLASDALVAGRHDPLSVVRSRTRARRLRRTGRVGAGQSHGAGLRDLRA